VRTSSGGLFNITVNSTTYSAYTSVAAHRRLNDLPHISQYLRSMMTAPGGTLCVLYTLPMLMRWMLILKSLPRLLC
jgi:hypothetical protein